jgi:hypothetical protein
VPEFTDASEQDQTPSSSAQRPVVEQPADTSGPLAEQADQSADSGSAMSEGDEASSAAKEPSAGRLDARSAPIDKRKAAGQLGGTSAAEEPRVGRSSQRADAPVETRGWSLFDGDLEDLRLYHSEEDGRRHDEQLTQLGTRNREGLVARASRGTIGAVKSVVRRVPHSPENLLNLMAMTGITTTALAMSSGNLEAAVAGAVFVGMDAAVHNAWHHRTEG